MPEFHWIHWCDYREKCNGCSTILTVKSSILNEKPSLAPHVHFNCHNCGAVNWIYAWTGSIKMPTAWTDPRPTAWQGRVPLPTGMSLL